VAVESGDILLIEDDPGIADTLQRCLTEEGFNVALERRGDEGLNRARHDPFHVVITDLRLPGLNGLDLVRELHAARPRLPIILVTAFGTTETAIEAMKCGAYDYVLKPFDFGELIDLTKKAAASSRFMLEPIALGQLDGGRDALVGRSPSMQAIYKEIGRVASKPVSVLIRGETGTGKELIARAIYQHSDRAHAPFVAINCAAIPETLLESELFGHERGAFTGAEARRIGRFEQADHGTIFLDEIGDMTPGTQVKLLRVLQERSLQRVGGRETIPVDVRVICATHRDLETAMREKLFREDLFYRLNVVVISVPPLRQRREDIQDLMAYFLRKFGQELGTGDPSIHPDALEFLRGQPWPGNVRELENVARRALLVSQGYTINVDHVRMALDKGTGVPEPSRRVLGEFVEQMLAESRGQEEGDVYQRVIQAVERELFGRAIQHARGNQAKASRWLGVNRITMRAKLVQFGLHPKQEQGPASDL
jgi:nitrogen regulation protein NR(I)